MPGFQAAAPGPLIWPSTCSTVPSAPSASIRCISAVAGRKRRLWPSASTTPASRQAATAASALALRQGEGLLDEDMLAGARGGDDLLGVLRCGVASTTACTSGSASTAS